MKEFIIEYVEKLVRTGTLTRTEWISLLGEYQDEETRNYVATLAVRIAQKSFGNKIYTRGLIEFTNYCKNNCNYCGIRRDNQTVDRYRLTEEEILECCEQGWKLDYRTFVLQGGEDGFYSDAWYESVLQKIKERYPSCAITLSIGERSKESYQRLYDAGADRYLLRHETASEEHYQLLHPREMSLANRKKCLYDLKEIGYQVGCGIMVGSPGQTLDTLAQDMEFIHELHPEMIGIGPFIPAEHTPFAKDTAGSLEMTLFLLSLLRIMEKDVLLPATTALGTLHPQGRELGIQAGANVVMPNLSPVSVRKKYALYDHKICTGEEAAECRGCLESRMNAIGYHLVAERGDHPGRQDQSVTKE